MLEKVLDLRVTNTLGQSEPIDSLQILYDNWIIDNNTFDLGDINQDTIIDNSIIFQVDTGFSPSFPASFWNIPGPYMLDSISSRNV